MEGVHAGRGGGASPPVYPATLQSLRHPRLLPRSIPPSFTLQSQLLGAEFCASLSAAMVNVMRGVRTAAAASSSSSSPSSSSSVVSPTTAMLLHDLSAHYGSHALRRAASYPLGPCYTSRRRRLSKGHHDGRRQLWSMRAAHRLWCRRCGVYLVAGETKQLLARTAPCAARLPDDEEGTTPASEKHPPRKAVSTRGTYVCCRCLKKELALWEKSGCVTTSPLPTPLPSAETVVEGEVPATSGPRNEYPLVAALSTVRVGRTRRRKRTRRVGDVTAVAQPKQLLSAVAATGNEPATLKAAVRAVPKGSLSRGKRGRTETPATRAHAAEGRRIDETVGLRGGNNHPAPLRKVARVEGSITAPVRPLHAAASSAISLTAATTTTTTTKAAALKEVQAPIEVQRLPRRGGRPAGRKDKNAGGAPSANSFADTMSRLGL